MTAPAGNQLRTLSSNDMEVETSPIRGDGFKLVPTATKIFIPSGAPVIFYDVLPKEGSERLGIASLILEPQAQLVESLGHVCARISSSSADKGLLAKVAKALLEHGFSRGLSCSLLVVPASEPEAVEAAASLSPSTKTQRSFDDRRAGVVFEYNSPDLA